MATAVTLIVWLDNLDARNLGVMLVIHSLSECGIVTTLLSGLGRVS